MNMSSGLQTRNFLKTCGILFCKPQRKIGLSQRNCALAACLNLEKSFLLTSAQVRRYQSSNVNPKIIPVMTEAQNTEDFMSMPKEAHHVSVGEANGWLQIGQYNVFAWSVSGVESCIVIKSEDVHLVFDMGVAVPESVRATNVFITHGHVDHIGAVANHVAKRGLNGMKPARYFVPPHLMKPLQTVMRAHFEMAETVDALEAVNIQSFMEGATARLNTRYFVKAFPTIHRIPSQGYILYKEEKKLKEEFRGMQGFEVAALYREGKDIHDVMITPEIAYTGDTVFEIFNNPPNPDLLKVKLLITECTFLDDDIGKNMIQKARDRGHTHLEEFAQNADLFKDVGHIVLVHFSNKYSPKYICDCLSTKLPVALKEKVTPATVAKATNATTYS